jgi:aminoglycoside phosphotransferase family enzyme/predicted kinase
MSTSRPTSPSVEGDQDAVIRRLRDPNVYPDHPREVKEVETHISRVFLTDHFVYKLKKSVKFKFLDFSTPEKREAACREEVALNRRMTHDVYLSILPITIDPSGEMNLGGRGRVIDWLVQMRRLPADRMLDEMIRTGRLADADVRRLADRLANYYVAAQPLTVRPEEYHTALVAHVKDNLQSLLASAEANPSAVRQSHAAQLRLLNCRPELFRSRARDGRVVDGHGDLRPEHICLTNPPAVYDCIEFSADLRRVDVLDELCFLAMDCDLLNADSVGRSILDAYLAKSGDRASPECIPFYKAYRACVRSKVAVLRARQLSGEGRQAQIHLSEQYLELANRYVRLAGTRPLLLVVTGLIGTGKSTLARFVAEELGIEILRTDEIRKETIPGASESDQFGEGRYRPEARARVYGELVRRAAEKLSVGTSVILDGTFTRAADRRAAVRCAHEWKADVFIVDCVCSRDTALRRIQARLHQNEPDASEARSEFYDLQAAERSCEENAAVDLRINTTESLTTQAAYIFKALPTAFPCVELSN